MSCLKNIKVSFDLDYSRPDAHQVMYNEDAVSAIVYEFNNSKKDYPILTRDSNNTRYRIGTITKMSNDGPVLHVEGVLQEGGTIETVRLTEFSGILGVDPDNISFEAVSIVNTSKYYSEDVTPESDLNNTIEYNEDEI